MERNDRARLHRLGAGYCYEAPGVYLWDEDRDEVLRAARELARGNRPRPTRRMLVIPPQEVAPAVR